MGEPWNCSSYTSPSLRPKHHDSSRRKSSTYTPLVLHKGFRANRGWANMRVAAMCTRQFGWLSCEMLHDEVTFVWVSPRQSDGCSHGLFASWSTNPRSYHLLWCTPSKSLESTRDKQTGSAMPLPHMLWNTYSKQLKLWSRGKTWICKNMPTSLCLLQNSPKWNHIGIVGIAQLCCPLF